MSSASSLRVYSHGVVKTASKKRMLIYDAVMGPTCSIFSLAVLTAPCASTLKGLYGIEKYGRYFLISVHLSMDCLVL